MSTTQETLLDISQLDAMATLLTACAIPFTTTDEALRCELSTNGKVYGVVYLVPAEGVFAADLEGRTFSGHFADIQDRVLGTEFYAQPRKDLYLLVVGDADFLAQPVNQCNACTVENNVNYGKKEVLTPRQAIDWLQGPFWKLADALRANPTPNVATVVNFGQAGQPEPNHMLDVEAILANSEESRYVVRNVAEAVYRRTMGADRKVFWPDNTPELGRVTDTEGLPVDFCSTGERIAFAFALFMARAMVDVAPSMCLGFRACFDRLDTVRQIGAFDCLRDFSAATGASIVVQSAKESLRKLVLLRARPVIEACGGQADDYPQRY